MNAVMIFFEIEMQMHGCVSEEKIMKYIDGKSSTYVNRNYFIEMFNKNYKYDALNKRWVNN